MPVSLAGLDLSWLSDPANRLPQAPRKQRINFRAKRSDKVASPFFMPDSAPYINIATKDTFEISSRSQQREFEKRTGYVQIGNDFGPDGSISAENNAKKARWDELSKGHTTPPEWVD